MTNSKLLRDFFFKLTWIIYMQIAKQTKETNLPIQKKNDKKKINK